MAGLNAPPPTWSYLLGENEKKVEFIEDTKIPDAATLTFNKEDHTLAGLLKSQLLLNKSVHFAGYKVPHPLEARFVMSVQTDGSITPWQAMSTACTELQILLGEIRKGVHFQANRHQNMGDAGYDDPL